MNLFLPWYLGYEMNTQLKQQIPMQIKHNWYLAKNRREITTILPIDRQSIRNQRSEEDLRQYIATKDNPAQMIEFQQVKPNESTFLRLRLPTDVKSRRIGYAKTSVALTMKYQLVKNDESGVLENFMGLYKFICFAANINIAKITGYSPRSLLDPILGQNEERQYQVQQNPINPGVFMLFNDKQYLHRECSLVLPSTQRDPMSQLLKATPLADKSLTVYVANDFKTCEYNIVGSRDQQNSLLWLIYNDLYANKRQGSQIVLSVFGIEHQNQLTDLLVIDTPTQINDYLPDYLRENPYLKRKIRVSKHPKNNKPFAENAFLQIITCGDDLRRALDKYTSIKNRMQAMKFLNYASWNWVQGELFCLSEIQSCKEDQTQKRTLRCHYVMRINQYFRSTASLMLKLGMNIRKMQQRNTNVICDNNESKLFKLLNVCFQKRKEKEQYQIYLILQIGHYKTLKDQYQNLVPTSELTNKIGQKTQDIHHASFIYLKHYHDQANLVALLSQLRPPKESTNIQEYLQECNEVQKPKGKSKVSINMKSFANDTFSSIEKKKYRNHLEDDDQTIQQDQHDNLQTFIKKTAKLYKKNQAEQRPETISGGNRSAFKKSENKTQHRMSLFDWGARSKSTRGPKIYISKNQKGRLSEIDRRSAEYISRKSVKLKKYDHLATIYGLGQKKQAQNGLRTYTSNQERTTKEMVDEIVHKEILELGKDDEYFQGQRVRD